MRRISGILGAVIFLRLLLGATAWGSNGKTQATAVSSLPAEAQSRISAALGRDLPDYRVRKRNGTLEAENAKQRLTAEFSAGGVSIQTGNTHWAMTLAGYGYGEALTPARSASPQASVNRVEYRRGPITEWYVNGPLGLEQGFTLNKRRCERYPSSVEQGNLCPGPLTIDLALSGGLTASVSQDGQDLVLSATGHAALRYAGLAAYDADGKRLRAWLGVRAGQLLLKADDADAHYPVTIDPFVQLAKLTASDGVIGDDLGYSAATSGNTVVVGAPYAAIGSNQYQGAVYLFVKPASGWTNMTQTAKLTASDGQPNDGLGLSVAINGSTVVAGAFLATIGANQWQGAAYVFVKPANGWTDMTQAAKLTASDGQPNDELGFSIGISGDTVVTGAQTAAIGSNAQQGAAYVFVKPANGWINMIQTAKLTSSDGASGDLFGDAVGISAGVALVGAYEAMVGSNSKQGAAYVFVEPSGGWTDMNQTAKLTATDGRPGDALGKSVSISGDTAVAGAVQAKVGSNPDEGAVYLFLKPTNGWANETQAAKLTASNGKRDSSLGFSVSVSGSTVAAGAPQIVGITPGAAYVFIKPVDGWRNMTQTASLTASDAAAGDHFGFSVAISGSTLTAGAPYATINGNTDQGAAYLFGP